MTGGAAAGEALIAEVDALVKQAPWRYTDAENRVLLGGYYLEVGADARQVLEVFYDQAKRSAPDAPEPHIAAGQLALQKGDFALAATSFQEALKRDAERPDAMLGLARAFLDSDQAKATEYLEQLLSKFPGFVPGLLLLAERQIDGELFDEATKTLDAMKEGISKSLETLSEVGDQVQEAAIRSGYGPTIQASSVKMLVDSVVGFQERSREIINEMRLLATKNSEEIRDAVEDGKRRLAKLAADGNALLLE